MGRTQRLLGSWWRGSHCVRRWEGPRCSETFKKQNPSPLHEQKWFKVRSHARMSRKTNKTNLKRFLLKFVKNVNQIYDARKNNKRGLCSNIVGCPYCSALWINWDQPFRASEKATQHQCARHARSEHVRHCREWNMKVCSAKRVDPCFQSWDYKSPFGQMRPVLPELATVIQTAGNLDTWDQIAI